MEKKSSPLLVDGWLWEVAFVIVNELISKQTYLNLKIIVYEN
jgi:hypothetical protein